MQCDRMGINPKWPSYKNLLARFRRSRRPFIERSREAFIRSLRDYISRADAAPTCEIPNEVNFTNDAAETLAYVSILDTLTTAPSNPRWLDDIARWLRYYQVGAGQNFFWRHRFCILFRYDILPCSNPYGGMSEFSTDRAAQMMALMGVLGWKKETLYQGYLAHAALKRIYMLSDEYMIAHRRSQVFMLRLFADWVGDASHRWPAYGYDEPIYEALLTHWRTPEPQALVPCLLAACDRHTHQSRKDIRRKFFDFGRLGLMRTPLEILWLMRLRQWEGLENPVLDHPLMAPPFDVLPPPQPLAWQDLLMQAVQARARADWPEYDAILSLEALKGPSD